MFTDCHIHMILDGVFYRAAIDSHRNGPVDACIRERLQAYQHAGAVYLRDGGDQLGVCVRAARLAGEYGIEYRQPGFPIHKNGHYGAFIGRGFADMREYRYLVREAGEGGADFIKLMISGLIDFNQYGRLTEESLTAQEIGEMIAIAHGEGFAVMVHANGSAAVRAAVAAGVDSVEHGAYMDADCLRALAQSNAVWVPTLATIGNLIGCGRHDDTVLASILQEQSEAVRTCAAMGGYIAPGSDSGAFCVPHAQGMLDEYNYLQKALGDTCEQILSAGIAKIRRRFVRGGAERAAGV